MVEFIKRNSTERIMRKTSLTSYLTLSLVLSALFFLPGAIADTDDESHCMAGDILERGTWTGSWLWLFLIFGVFGGLFLFAFLFLAQQSQQSRVPNRSKDGLRIAEERLAKGEITPEQFDDIKRRIQ